MPSSPRQHRPPGYRPRPKNHGSTAAQRGYGRRWREESKTFLLANPLCCYCWEKGKKVAATCVDHARPHKGDPVLFWDQTNWRPACGPCNSRKCAEQEGGFGRRSRYLNKGYDCQMG
jgi:5-methylcytosine-specific restriction protein A